MGLWGVTRRWREPAVCGVGDGVDDVVAPRRWSVRLVSSASAKRMAVGQTGIPMRPPLGASCEWGYGGVARRWRESAICGVGDGVDDGWRVADALFSVTPFV